MSLRALTQHLSFCHVHKYIDLREPHRTQSPALSPITHGISSSSPSSPITASVFSYSLSVSFWTQDLALQQILSSIDLYLYYRSDYTDYRSIHDFTLLNGCTGKCVRLSRLLAFECTLNHCTFISFHFTVNSGTTEVKELLKELLINLSPRTTNDIHTLVTVVQRCCPWWLSSFENLLALTSRSCVLGLVMASHAVSSSTSCDNGFVLSKLTLAIATLNFRKLNYYTGIHYTYLLTHHL